MPAYNSQPVRALYPGSSINLIDNAATDTGITKTQQFAIGPNPVNISNVINFINTTDQDATGYVAASDVDANYAAASGLIVAKSSALPYNLADGFVRFSFGTAPSSGSLTAAR